MEKPKAKSPPKKNKTLQLLSSSDGKRLAGAPSVGRRPASFRLRGTVG